MKLSFLGLKKLFIEKNIFEKVPLFLGKHAFLVVLVFISFAIALGGFLFYNYVVVVGVKEPEISKNSFKFREDMYQKIIGQWQSKEQKQEFQQSLQENYSNPFAQPE